jgi:haloacetate dehalogenase
VFEGFRDERIDTGEAEVRVRHGGSGPPLLLLHGHPQTGAMWHRVAGSLAERFTLVIPDLRGYGASSKPPTTPDHEPYSKRAMARDQVATMAALGFERFGVAGHDRGGRVAYRLALDHRDRVDRLAVLDIVPTGEAYRRADHRFGLIYWHWFFLPQPEPLPERLIAADPEAIYFTGGREAFEPQALEEYWAAIADPETVHSMCEDYRAGATIDFELDEADLAAGRRIEAPLLAMWGARGALPVLYEDVEAIWRDWADDVRGIEIDCGHYLPEEAPEEVASELEAFFYQSGSRERP